MILFSYYFNVFPVTVAFGNSILQSCIKSDLVDKTQTSCTDLKVNPTSLFHIIEFLAEEVDIKVTLCMVL
jgi:hypothetical protein